MEKNGNRKSITNLTGLIDVLVNIVDEEETISLRPVMERIGFRSFGPVLLVSGLIMALPIVGDVPGVPTAMGAVIILSSIQMLLRREHVWFPDWILDRTMKSKYVLRALLWSRQWTKRADRLIKPRMQRLTYRGGSYAAAVMTMFIGLTTPIMEIVPLSGNVAGVAIMGFGISLMAQDGLIALLAFLFSVALYATIISFFLYTL